MEVDMGALANKPIELRMAGVRALMDALGDDDARQFLELWRGIPGADFNKWLNAQPEKSLEELEEEIMQAQQTRANGRHAELVSA
jgi:hypothetical protein